MINSFYGKTMENLRKRINVRLKNNEKDFLKYTSNTSITALLKNTLMLNFYLLTQTVLLMK